MDYMYIAQFKVRFYYLNLNLPGTPNTSKRVLHGVRAQMAVPKASIQKNYVI